MSSNPMAFAPVLYPGRCLASQPTGSGGERAVDSHNHMPWFPASPMADVDEGASRNYYSGTPERSKIHGQLARDLPPSCPLPGYLFIIVLYIPELPSLFLLGLALPAA